MVKQQTSARGWSVPWRGIPQLGREFAQIHVGTSTRLPVPDDSSATQPVRVGSVIRARRLALGLSLTALAERVGYAKSYLSSIETGRKGPPAGELLAKIEAALRFEPGHLERAARWEQAPAEVRRDLAALQQDRRTLQRLAELVSREGLEGAVKSGELARLIGGARASEKGELSTALPAEVPVISMVSADGVGAFTDLGYPARVADEYVRCPDLHDPDAFAARVVGDAMDPDYRPGDIVVFSPARDVTDGCDCFVRLVRDRETTFKRVYFEVDAEGREVVRIQPINNRYPSRTVAREQVAGLYRAASVIRSL